ncbi:hypothetical protein [Roseateles toxinivorans]|uniref:hypothetical protein n=1 Tax=Roseateles toxinivorans TaxID=270368 RepID=UPI00141528FB|nr:hypothetical protein [Roseateles toxinivorans]
MNEEPCAVAQPLAWAIGQRDGTKLELDFIETVVFVKSNGHWLMDRYHATKLRETVIGG